MKRIFALLCVGLMASLVCSCGDDEDSGSGIEVEIEEEKTDSIPEFDVKVPNAKALLQEGRTWEVALVEEHPSYGKETGEYQYYAVDGDSVLNGLEYKKVMTRSTYDPSSDWKLYSLMREDGNKVYKVKAGDKEEKLDFDLGIQLGENVIGYPLTNISERVTGNDGLKRRIYTFCELSDTLKVYVEGIGDLRGFGYDRGSTGALTKLKRCLNADGTIAYE